MTLIISHSPWHRPRSYRNWWTISCAFVLAVSTVMFLVSFSTRAWMVSYDPHHNLHTEAGLWRVCVHSRNIETICQSIENTAGKFRACQAFMCLAFVGFIAAWIILVMSIIKATRARMFVIASVICPFFVAFLLMVAIAAMADQVQDSLGYSFYLSVFSCLLALLAGILRGPELMTEDADSSGASKPGFVNMPEVPSTATMSSFVANPSLGYRM